MTTCQLSSIAIQVESNQVENQQQYPNVRSILVEVQHALEQFHHNGHKRIIDLGAIPMAAYERHKLLQLLGQGEVEITLNSLGKSEIYESLLSAVWVIKHYDEDENISAMFIEVTRVPDIVLSQIEDLESLTQQIQELISRTD